MKATIDGVLVEGTPEEVAALLKTRAKPTSLAERMGIRPLTHEEQKKRDRIVALLERTPNINITPLGRICTGERRYC